MEPKRVDVTLPPTPVLCPACGENADAGCGEPCILITYARGPTDPPAIGPVYHVRCWGRDDPE